MLWSIVMLRILSHQCLQTNWYQWQAVLLLHNKLPFCMLTSCKHITTASLKKKKGEKTSGNLSFHVIDTLIDIRTDKMINSCNKYIVLHDTSSFNQQFILKWKINMFIINGNGISITRGWINATLRSMFLHWHGCIVKAEDNHFCSRYSEPSW